MLHLIADAEPERERYFSESITPFDISYCLLIAGRLFAAAAVKMPKKTNAIAIRPKCWLLHAQKRMMISNCWRH